MIQSYRVQGFWGFGLSGFGVDSFWVLGLLVHRLQRASRDIGFQSQVPAIMAPLALVAGLVAAAATAAEEIERIVRERAAQAQSE